MFYVAENNDRKHVARRHRSFNEHYNHLNPEQWEAVYFYSKYGYQLSFVRIGDNHEPNAYLVRDDVYIMVNEKGDTIFNPAFKLRDM